MAVLTKPKNEISDNQVPYRYLNINAGEEIWLTDLAKEVCEETGFTLKAAKEFIRTLSVVLRRHMVRGDIIQLKGIGKFFSYERSPHQRYSFKEQRMMDYGSMMIPKFMFSESFVEYYKEHFGEDDRIIGDAEDYDGTDEI